MENNRIKCKVDTEKVKLVNKDNFDIVNYIESDIKLQPPDCSLYSEEGFEIPIHKEVLYQTKFMREMLKSMDCCFDKVELFFPTLAKEDLEVMVNFLYNGKIICRNRSDLCKVVVNLTQFLGFPNYMDLRSITNCYPLQGDNNKIKDVKKDQTFAATNGNTEQPPNLKSFGTKSELKNIVTSREQGGIEKMKTEVKTEVKDEPFGKFEAREQGGIDFITSKDFDTSFNKPEFPTQNVKRKVKTEVKKDPYGKFEAKEQDGIDFVTTGHLRVNDPDDADESNNLDESYDSDDLDSSISSNFVDKQEAELDSPDEIDLSKNKSTDDEMSDASIVEEIDESMDLKTECFNFLNNYESSFNNVPDIEPIKTSNFESEKIPTNPIFLHCTICKNKHTRFLTQTELDKHMATFHVQKTVNGFKVISLSKNVMEGTKEIVFEKHESGHQMKDIQKKTEVEVEIGTPKSKKKKSIPHLKCPECDKIFVKNHSLEHHMRVIHKKTQEEIVAIVHEKKTLLKCSACEKSYSTAYKMQVHFEFVHEGKNGFECNLCGKKYAMQYPLKCHIESIHEGIKPHVCHLCGYATSNKAILKNHIAIVHEGQRPYSCDTCEKTFKRNTTLKNHKALAHDGKKPFKCHTCDKTFVLKQDMQKHAFIHTNIRPHECNACDAKFKRSHHLTTHLRTIHGLVK